MSLTYLLIVTDISQNYLLQYIRAHDFIPVQSLMLSKTEWCFEKLSRLIIKNKPQTQRRNSILTFIN
jgi:hypothetical protein